MRHTRAEVIVRTIREFELLDHLVAGLTDAQWQRPLLRSKTMDPWTVKDALAHITHWKADTARRVRGQPKPPEERGLNESDANHLIYLRWRDHSAQEILKWHRQVQKDVLAALQEAPEAWFNGKEHRAEWPYDLYHHASWHRVKEIERVLQISQG
jgi:hypothetical protein